jgi:cytoplasmic iron level regulating protein YaaA (DUF328/UPF0246 family)
LKKQLYSIISKRKISKYLADLMEISAKLADENWQRNQVWKPKPTAKESCPALFALQEKFTVELMPKHLTKRCRLFTEKPQNTFWFIWFAETFR